MIFKMQVPALRGGMIILIQIKLIHIKKKCFLGGINIVLLIFMKTIDLIHSYLVEDN